MTFDGFALSSAFVEGSFRRTLAYLASIHTFHLCDVSETLYGVEGWPSCTSAVEGMTAFIRLGEDAGWIRPVDPENGWYSIFGVEAPQPKPRACV